MNRAEHRFAALSQALTCRNVFRDAFRRFRSTGQVWRAAASVGLVVAGMNAASAPLTLAVAELPSLSPALLAQAEGYFAAEGLDMRVLYCVNGRRCLQHLTDGQADLATVADTPIVMASHAGHAFDIVATFGVSHEHRLVARADRGIRVVSDLKGKRIGFVRGTSAHYFTDNTLLLSGINPDSVSFVPLEAAEIVNSLAGGKIDAAGLYAPHAQLALRSLGCNAVEPVVIPFYAVTFNLVSQTGPRAVADRDLVRVLRALRRACEVLKAEPVRAKALIATRLKLEPALLEAIRGRYEFLLSLDQSLLTTLEAESRWAVREHLVSGANMPDYLERMRPGPLRQVDPRAVRLLK